jgi:transcriptional regulator with XRE-family HTH domain
MRMTQQTIGDLLRDWRQRRRMSQLELATEAGISQRHLSFIESGRASPSRGMLRHLADRLNVPLRDQNQMMLAAGFAPSFPERDLSDPDMAAVRTAIDLVLKGYGSYPALAVDRHWNLVTANEASMMFLGMVRDQALLAPPVNVLRLSLHPDGLAPHIINLAQWRHHLMLRLRRQIDLTADAGLIALEEELASYPAPAFQLSRREEDMPDGVSSLVLPFQLRVGDAVLSFIGMTSVFGSPVDVTLSELALETFLPADGETSAALRAMLPSQASG